ncbi:hypothetical protein GSJ18_03430 [Bordetella pertussis]|uniref:hypothetical protein n=1 Tax=Bordetella pertussis TaxID=520 RepID=UPI0002F61B2C|nr:hypothetical protein [Bordetella pertussis]ETH17284.1 hypothetical protein L575_0143 [Bordetella pertussis STO1-SEAT-0007]AMS70758.1 hypothetical protein RD15_17300 [Bordetella pertussis]AMS74368.1 hypothetical protein RD16_17095 [Bordetella pertussis]AQC94874.1 hypothetical protein AC888_17080 [Bordetella pertussis]AQK10571.1 hypothetical protein AVS79_03405 [Bordetella pertussis]
MNWGVGDFQFLKSGSDEPCIQPIESSHLEARAEAMFEPLEAAMLGDADPYSDSSLAGLRNVRTMLSDLLSRSA